MDWRDEWQRMLAEEWPLVAESPNWEAVTIHRRTGWENRPGLKMLRVTVLDKDGNKLGGVKVRFDTEPGDSGTIYDHRNIWGETGVRSGREGYAEWEHFGVPTRYMMWLNDELFISNLRTDLGYEYPIPPGQSTAVSWRPTNRPGFYSYDITVQQK